MDLRPAAKKGLWLFLAVGEEEGSAALGLGVRDWVTWEAGTGAGLEGGEVVQFVPSEMLRDFAGGRVGRVCLCGA